MIYYRKTLFGRGPKLTAVQDYRKDRSSFNPARLTALQKALASLGRTPVDRSRLAAPEPVVDPNDPWAKLIRDYG